MRECSNSPDHQSSHGSDGGCSTSHSQSPVGSTPRRSSSRHGKIINVENIVGNLFFWKGLETKCTNTEILHTRKPWNSHRIRRLSFSGLEKVMDIDFMHGFSPVQYIIIQSIFQCSCPTCAMWVLQGSPALEESVPTFPITDQVMEVLDIPHKDIQHPYMVRLNSSNLIITQGSAPCGHHGQ